MVKNEIKVEFSNSEELKKIIEKSYFQNGLNGKINGKENYISITKEDDVNWTIFKGLNNVTVKITNDVIDGSMRFIIDDTDDNEVKLFPISIYCIKEDEKYSFY